MFKNLVLVVFLALGLNAASQSFTKQMGYETDYKVALKKAKAQNKPIMMVVSTKSCPWCRKLERQTLKKNIVNNIISKEFIPLAINRSKTAYPRQFKAKVVPTVFFIDPNVELSYYTSFGYKDKKTFTRILTTAKNKYIK